MDVLDMHIAQLSVAGEEQTRSESSLLDDRANDRQALAEFACDRSNLPWVIFRAAHRANHVAELPARARCVLAALARTVDAARPFAAIFARRELLTGRALQSMRTFYRSLDDLERAGFVVRPPQTRYVEAGLFGRAYLHLTPMATSLLGLTADEPATQDPGNSKPTTNSASPDETLHAGPSATLAHGAIYKDLYPTNQKRQPGRLPADLERLRVLGFRDFLIFKLMGEASRYAKRLSDIVEASWDHLRRASHPINYLRALLRTPVDFAHRVRTKNQMIDQATQKTEATKTARAAAAELAGKQFASVDGVRTYLVAADGASVIVRHRDERQPRVHTGAWVHDFLAGIRAGHIAPATLPNREDSNASGQTARNDEAPPNPRANRATPAISSRLIQLKQLLRAKQSGVDLQSKNASMPSHVTGARNIGHSTPPDLDRVDTSSQKRL
jgi:hypothetical protein